METILERWSAGQVIGLVSILVGAIVAVTMILSITKYQLQALAEDTALQKERQQVELALKQKLVDRGMSGANLDALLVIDTHSSGGPNQVDVELAKLLGSLNDAEAGDIEETLARVMATDPARKQQIVEVIMELQGDDANHAAILAAVRPLCTPATAGAQLGGVVDSILASVRPLCTPGVKEPAQRNGI